MATDRNDELLKAILARQDNVLAVLGDIRDRLPVPAPASDEPVPGGGPVAVVIKEPAASADPAPARTPRKRAAPKAAPASEES